MDGKFSLKKLYRIHLKLTFDYTLNNNGIFHGKYAAFFTDWLKSDQSIQMKFKIIDRFCSIFLQFPEQSAPCTNALRWAFSNFSGNSEYNYHFATAVIWLYNGHYSTKSRRRSKFNCIQLGSVLRHHNLDWHFHARNIIIENLIWRTQIEMDLLLFGHWVN